TRGEQTSHRAKAVEAIRIGFRIVVIEGIHRGVVGRHNGIFDFYETTHVENPAAVIRGAAGNTVGCNRTLAHYNAGEAVKETAAMGHTWTAGSSAAIRDVAAHGAAEHIYRAIVIGHAATSTGAARVARSAHSQIATDRAAVQFERAKTIGDTAAFSKSPFSATAAPCD